MSTKTLRVALADITGPTGGTGSTATVHARYVSPDGRGRDVHLTDGTIVVPVRRTDTGEGSPQVFEFTVYANDAAPVREVDYGFLVEVAWTVVSPERAKTSGSRRVEVRESFGAVLELGLLASPTPVTPAPYAGAYVLPGDLAAHAQDGTNVHGIPDTSALIVEGDPRLSDARTPTAHAASHATGGSDPVTPASIGAAAKTKTVQGGQYFAPVRVPSLSVVEAWPNPAAPFDRLIWTESAGATLYAYGRDRSIRKSTDSGRTWTRNGFTPAEFTSTFWKTTAGSLIGFRYDWNALYRSTDDGATWTSVHTLPFKQLLGPQSICEDLVTGNLYYAEYPTATGRTSPTANLWRSTDDGATWSVFYTFNTSGAGSIDHIHTIQWDHIAERVVISTGDSNPASGLYRINAAGTGVEPMVLQSNLPGADLGIPRSIGIIPTTNYIVWAADTGSVPWVCRMHRSQIGLASPVVEKVYRLNSSAWWSCRASDDGSRWVVCASGENPTYRIDAVSHLYAIEDEGATVYEIGTIRARKEDTVTLAPVGAPGNHGSVFFMQTYPSFEPGTWKFALGLGSGVAIPWPHRIQVPLTKTVNYGPVTLAAGAEIVFAADTVPFRAPELHLFDAGAYGAGSAGVKSIVRVAGVDKIVAGNVNERNARQAEWGAAFQTFALAGGATVEFVIKNNGGSTVTAATAFVTFGWGSGIGFV